MMQRLARFVSRLSIRLLAFNVLLVFLPAAGILSLETYERQLLDRQERSMVQQARIFAAALGGRGEVTPEAAESILINMNQELDARLRVIDRDFTLVADSSRLGPQLEPEEPAAEPEPELEIRDSPLYRLGNVLYQTYTRLFLPPEPPRRDAGFYAAGRKLAGPEIEKALSGTYGA
ncbi:MAG: histidine kinase, partial [Acidobacteriota bacterium]